MHAGQLAQRHGFVWSARLELDQEGDYYDGETEARLGPLHALLASPAARFLRALHLVIWDDVGAAGHAAPTLEVLARSARPALDTLTLEMRDRLPTESTGGDYDVTDLEVAPMFAAAPRLGAFSVATWEHGTLTYTRGN